jgi:hypothetical protein
MAEAQKPDFVFRLNGRVHLNQRGRQFSRLLSAEVCASAVVMLDTPCSEVAWRVLSTHSNRQFPLHFASRASPCAITFQLESNIPKDGKKKLITKRNSDLLAFGDRVLVPYVWPRRHRFDPTSVHVGFVVEKFDTEIDFCTSILVIPPVLHSFPFLCYHSYNILASGTVIERDTSNTRPEFRILVSFGLKPGCKFGVPTVGSP